MSGISKGGSGFNYVKAFKNSSVNEIKSQFTTKIEKKELHLAAEVVLASLAEDFQLNSSQGAKTQFLQLGEKFAQIFPEDKDSIDLINNLAHTVMGSKEAGPKPVTKFDYKNVIKSAENPKDIELAIKLGADKAQFMNAARELAKEMILDGKIPQSQLKGNLKVLFENVSSAGGYSKYYASELGETITSNRDAIKGLLTSTKTTFSLNELGYLSEILDGYNKLPLPDGFKERVEKAEENLAKQYQVGLDYKNVIKTAKSPEAIKLVIKFGADKDQFMNAARELAKEMVLDDKIPQSQLKGNLKVLFENVSSAGGYSNYILSLYIDKITSNRDAIKGLLTSTKTKFSLNELAYLSEILEQCKEWPLPDGFKERVEKAEENLAKQYKVGLDYKNVLKTAESPEAIKLALKFGADKAQFMIAARELAKEMVLDDKIPKSQLKGNLKVLFENVSSAGGYRKYKADKLGEKVTSNRDAIKGLITSTKTTFSLNELAYLSEFLEEYNQLPLPDGFKEGLEKAKENLAKQYQVGPDNDYKNVLKSAGNPKAIELAIEFGADKAQFMNAARELAKEMILDDKIPKSQLKDNLKVLFSNASSPGGYSKLLPFGIIGKITSNRDAIKGLLTSTKTTLPLNKLNELTVILEEYTKFPLPIGFKEGVIKGYASILHSKAEKLSETLKTEVNIEVVTKSYKDIQDLLHKGNVPIPAELKKKLSKKVLPIYKVRGSQNLNKILEGKVSELSLADIEKVVAEIDSFGTLPVPDEFSVPKIADAILEYVKTYDKKIKNDPTIATKAHHILHDLAQIEIVNGNYKSAFKIQSQAAAGIPLSESHPLHEMDKAILAGAEKQLDPKYGANFSSLDTSIVKGGNLHATQRVIDGKLTNSFDFKISHYARDELTRNLEVIVNNLEDFKASLPKGFCTDVTINEGVPQQYIRFDQKSNEFTRTGAYNPGDAAATEIVFEGVGKVIIGNKKDVGCMYNWIQVEMDANLPSGEGAQKLHQLLSVVGVGPVIGQQPSDSDERMKIAQLFRAFYPSKATAFDTTKEFYQLPINELKDKIIAKEPGMDAYFKRYLETNPSLMKKIEIMPGKKIWVVTDLGEKIRAKGAYGLMTGVGYGVSGWPSTKGYVARALTEGKMASEQRYKAGVFEEGASSESDLCSGGGDQVFTRMVNANLTNEEIRNVLYSGNAQILWDMDSVAQRVPYGSYSDSFGVKSRFDSRYSTRYLNRRSLMELAENVIYSGNEVMVKNSLDPSHIVGIVVKTPERKKELIEHLVKEKIAEDRDGTVFLIDKNVEAEKFIHVGTKFNKSMWG